MNYSAIRAIFCNSGQQSQAKLRFYRGVCVLRLGNSSLAGREETVGVGCTADGRSDRFLADVSLCPLPDGHPRRCAGGRRLRMDGGEAGRNVLAEELCKE